MVKRTWMALLLLVAPAVGEPVSFEKEFEVRLSPAGSRLEEPLRGDPERTMELVKELYRLAGPKIGSRFVESCYLLCLGDLRPYAAWNGPMTAPAPEDDEVIERLNRYLVPRGWSLHPRRPDGQGRVDSFSLHSLEGLEKRTRESKLSWVPRYRRSTGWAGYYAWKKQIWAQMPNRGEANYARVEGIMLGYPDAAVEHFGGLVRDWPSTVDAWIPGAATYQCGLPVFSLRYQDAADPAVIACEQEWSEFLQRAYAGAAHRELAADPEFQRARYARITERCDSLGLPQQDVVYAETRRAGLTALEAERNGLNSELERWLEVHGESLAQALRLDADLPEVAHQLEPHHLRGEHIRAWLVRGASEPESAAGRAFQSYRQAHPQPLDWLIRREVVERAARIQEQPDTAEPARDGEAFSRLLNSGYVHDAWMDWPAEQRRRIRAAAELRKAHPPLQRFLDSHPG